MKVLGTEGVLTCCHLLQYGRENLAEIAREIEGKTEEEVRTYSKTFWERHTELADQDRSIKNIGELLASVHSDVPGIILGVCIDRLLSRSSFTCGL